MNAGLPIVGWRAGNLPHLADHEREALLVAPGDVIGLSAALRRLVEDEPMRRRLGANARTRASTRPTWDETAAAFFAAIRSVKANDHPS
jgi:glycosyltransferase involved in cell wall biosynthesis